MAQKKLRILHLGAASRMKNGIEVLEANGHQVFVVDQDPGAALASLVQNFEPIDIKDEESLSTYALKNQIDVVLARNEVGLLAQARVGSVIRSDHSPSLDSALACTNKDEMRKRWDSAGIPQPRYSLVNSLEEAEKKLSSFSFPVILKPCLGYGNRGVFLLENPQSIRVGFSFAAGAFGEDSGGVLIEEKVSGSEYSVEAFIQNGQLQVLAVGEKEIAEGPYPITLGIHYPALLDENEISALEELVNQAAQALGLENGAVHADFLKSGSKWIPLELTNRPGGGHIFSDVVPKVSGVDYPEVVVQSLAGNPVDLPETKSNGLSYRFVIPPRGCFEGIQFLSDLNQLPGHIDFGLDLKEGTEVNEPKQGSDRPGYILCEGKNLAEARENSKRVLENIQFKMRGSR